MIEQSLTFFANWFSNPNFTAMGIAIVIGIIWYAAYRPGIRRDYGFLWVVMGASAILTLLAIVIIQMPLQALVGQLLALAFAPETLLTWLYVLGIPQVALSGLVQEGAKMIPMIVVWQRSEHYLDAKVGLLLGAAAGLGFGVFEAMWALNQAYAGGWTLAGASAGGFLAIAPVWERFFAVGGHVAFSALVGYGLATERGWIYYLIAAGLHGLMNYTIVLLQSGLIGVGALEVLAALVAIGASAWALYVRYSGDGAPWGRSYRRRLHLGKEPSEYAKM